MNAASIMQTLALHEPRVTTWDSNAADEYIGCRCGWNPDRAPRIGLHAPTWLDHIKSLVYANEARWESFVSHVITLEDVLAGSIVGREIAKGAL